MNETKEEILKIAFKLFLAKGYENVSMSEVAKRSGISKGGLYHHFPSKDKLYEETLENYFFFYFEHFNNIELNDKETSVKEKIRRLCDEYIKPFQDISKILDEEHQNYHYYLLLIQSAQKYAKLRDQFQRFSKWVESYLDRILRQGKDNKEITANVNTTLMAKHILFLLEGTAFASLFESYKTLKINYERIFSQLLNTILI